MTTGRGPAVDWAALRSAAAGVARRAYAPYSGFHVGAAGLVDDGSLVVGCNVENASYGVTLCAECSLVSAFVTSAGRPFGDGGPPGQAPEVAAEGPDPASATSSEAGGGHPGGAANGRLVAVAVCDPEGNDLACCGRCRQLLFEVGGPALVVNERAITDWLPGAFGPADLDD